jgi:cytochrome b6
MPRTLGERVGGWFAGRLPVDALRRFVQEKKVPYHRGSIWYYFGGVSLFLFIIQVCTGILLMMYYQPGVQTAFESVRFIVVHVRFGWLVRSIHTWSANLFIFTVFVHMFSVFFTKAFRRPHELTWLTGLVLLGLSLAFGFSGYLLPWNTLAYFATKVGTAIVSITPGIGPPLTEVLRGGRDVGAETLVRFFGLHVAILPALFTAVLGAHLLLVQVLGMHEPRGWRSQPAEKRRYMPFFPNFLLRDVLLWLIVLNVLAILAVLYPWELGHKADPGAPAPVGIKPEWYFLSGYQALKYFPPKILGMDGDAVGVVAFGLAGLLWALVPFWDARVPEGARNRVLNYLGLTVVLTLLALTGLGLR